LKPLLEKIIYAHGNAFLGKIDWPNEFRSPETEMWGVI
jgi:hypothetical protein